jgi:6-phosphogluconolactonase (cycloisomerase 2 family)
LNQSQAGGRARVGIYYYVTARRWSILNLMSSHLHVAMLALLLLVPAPAATNPQTVLYAAVGADVTVYSLDPHAATLTKRSSVTLPANVQEAWQSGKFLYVAWSNGGASYTSTGVTPKNDPHGITAFRIDAATGALSAPGEPAALPSRPIFITADIDGTHVITAHNDPSALVVHRILPDGTLGAEVPPAGQLDFGIYGHQVRVDPSNKTVILVTRGNGPTAAKPEDPGALKIFAYRNGVLSNSQSIAPNNGFGYQARHLDFHPSGKWVYVTLERQNQIHVYSRMPDGTLSPRPLFVKDTLAKPATPGANQSAASIHFHPNGKFVYVSNRASDPATRGENNIAVFAINQQTGEPTLIQSIDTQGFEPRTFSLDPPAGILAVANQLPLSNVPASLVLFRVGTDGKLNFAKKYDIETGHGRTLFWTKILSLR